MTPHRNNMKSVEIYNKAGEIREFRSIMEASAIIGMSPHTLRRRLADGYAFNYLGTTWRARAYENY